jgi:hypothetical protein
MIKFKTLKIAEIEYQTFTVKKLNKLYSKEKWDGLNLYRCKIIGNGVDKIKIGVKSEFKDCQFEDTSFTTDIFFGTDRGLDSWTPVERKENITGTYDGSCEDDIISRGGSQ